MIPTSLFAIHWTVDGTEGMVRDPYTLYPDVWPSREEAEHYIALTHLGVEQHCTVVEYVLRPTAGGEG